MAFKLLSLLSAFLAVNGALGYGEITGFIRLPANPGPLADTSAKLVHTPDHPYMPPMPWDQRGPCPGMNTLANHGFIPRSGVATPQQIISASMEVFNMGHNSATFVTMAAFINNGNLITNLVSIGGKSILTGPDWIGAPKSTGFSTHGTFEGDAGFSRADAYFGDNHSFNATLWGQLTEYANQYGGGAYNFTVAAEFRHKRIYDSIATNPEFNYVVPRFFTSYTESVFPIAFFVDGRSADPYTLDMTVARRFFEDARLPVGFHRSNTSWTIEKIKERVMQVFSAYPILPGTNQGAVNTYTHDPTSATLANFCHIYEDIVNKVTYRLYPNATGELRNVLQQNLDKLYTPLIPMGCTQVPYNW